MLRFAPENAMTLQINVAEAKAKLSELLDRALAGEEIVIARAGKPLARLVPVETPGRRKPGAWREWGANISAEVCLEPMDPEDLDAAEVKFSDEFGSSVPRLEQDRYLYCLFCQVRDETPEEVRCNVEKVVRVCVAKQGTIVEMMASLQLVVFGAPLTRPLEELRQSWGAASEELLAALGRDIRIVAFSGNLAFG
jgi:prevent-host-death family protein